ncbi:MAG: alpha/beta fold hydrolase [Candidatus Woesearchaeota archaeon]|jgi:esterase/lipase
MNRTYIGIIILLFFLSSCGTETTIPKDPNEITLTTSDEINLTAKYYETNAGYNAVLLLHMVGGDKYEYDTLLPTIMKNSYSALALDFRGHGNSDLNYTTFTESDWQKIIIDVQTGIDFLESKGYTQITVIGASIGANAALKHAVQDTRIDNLILISAGEEYHGLNALDYAPFYDRPILVIASMDDKDAAIAATKIYNAVNTEQKEIKLYQTGGHGTNLLITQEDLPAIIGTWLYNYY